MRVLGVIPARGNSKGIPQKNMRELNKMPLVYWTIKAAKESNLDECYVSTECPKIANFAESLNFGVIDRPSEYSQDSVSAVDVAIHAMELKDPRKEKYDAVMMLLPTSPLRTASHINSALEIFQGKDMKMPVIGVCEDSILISKRHISNKNILYKPPAVKEQLFNLGIKNPQRQNCMPLYTVNGAMFLASCAHLRSYGTFHLEETLPLRMTKTRSVDVNDYEDFKLAEALMSGR